MGCSDHSCVTGPGARTSGRRIMGACFGGHRGPTGSPRKRPDRGPNRNRDMPAEPIIAHASQLESSQFSRPDGLSVSVAICAYTERRWGVLRRAVSAAAAQLREDDEIILVVDHCSEVFDRACREMHDVRILSNRFGQGLSGARNTAVEAARGDIVAFLDDDAVPCDGWLEALLAPYVDEAVIGVGGHVVPVWPDVPPPWLPTEFLWVVGCSYTGLPVGLSAIRNPIGANMSFRRRVFARAGAFSEALGRVGTVPVGCEETELSMRVARAFPENAIVLHPASVVEHEVTEERATFAYFRRRCWSEGMSKAVVTRGSNDRNSLSTERRYVLSSLRRGLIRDIASLLRGDVYGLARAAVAIVGLLWTAGGYAIHLKNATSER